MRLRPLGPTRGRRYWRGGNPFGSGLPGSLDTGGRSSENLRRDGKCENGRRTIAARRSGWLRVGRFSPGNAKKGAAKTEGKNVAVLGWTTRIVGAPQSGQLQFPAQPRQKNLPMPAINGFCQWPGHREESGGGAQSACDDIMGARLSFRFIVGIRHWPPTLRSAPEQRKKISPEGCGLNHRKKKPEARQ